MSTSNDQLQIARLKRNNERLTIFCLILGVIAIGAGLYGKIQYGMARELRQLAIKNAERAMNQAKQAEALSVELIRQRAAVERLQGELDAFTGKSKKTK